MKWLSRTLLSKLAWAILAFVLFYLIADPFGWVPQSVKDSIKWFGDNVFLIVFCVCFLAACYVVVRLKAKNKGVD